MSDLYLKAGRVLVGNGETLNDAALLIRNGIIAEVDSAPSQGLGVDVLDFSDRVILPGIIDAHVHVCHDGTVFDPAEVRNATDEFLAIRGAKLAEDLLAHGITGAGDAASRGEAGFAVRYAIEKGVVNGPRLLLCGRMITITGGRDSIFGPNEADGPDEVRRATRQEIARGAHFIKLAATGAISSEHTESMSTQFTKDEMQVAAEEARKVGKLTHAHAYGDVGISNTILAGVDVLVHGHPLSDDNIALMKKHGTMLMPTLVTYYESQKHHEDGNLPAHMVRKEKELFPLIESGFRNAVNSKIEVALGSDSGMPYTPFGRSSMEELELMVKMGGMSEMEAIVAGTRNAARSISIDKITGTLETGKSADLLVLAAGKDPTRDIALLQQKQNIELVMLRGRSVIKR
ncbi:MAG: amidohydrolase family protein [Candidatus Thorarchaeota archaeon]|nr:amidohydrolase family protein [Candidatus Thorarchaeota archaeon]